MSRPEVNGVPLDTLVEPIYSALNRLMEVSDGKFRISGKAKTAATKLELTPDKPNSARSTTEFKHLGEVAGKLFIIAFAPGDGTGEESPSLKLRHLNTEPYPALGKIVPRFKFGIASEVHFPVATARIDSPSSDMFENTGNLELLGLPTDGNPFGDRIGRIGQLGQWEEDFRRIIEGEVDCPTYPMATQTLWYETVNGATERMGEPHAVYNGHEDVVQVCGFMAILDEMASEHASFARDLHAVPAN